MQEIPDNFFTAQQMLAESIKSQAEHLGEMFRHYDVRTSIALAGGLLTVPELQANTVRLEAIAHLVVTNSVGKKKPHKQDAARWFKQVGQVVSRMEDPAEDVFVTRVHMDGRNYRIFEGLAEANGHHLQHMLTAVEHMPDRGIYGSLKKSCREMLALADIICERSNLEAFCGAGEYGFDALSIDNLPTSKTLAARVTFSRDDLAQAGLSQQALSRFYLAQAQRDIGLNGDGNSWLERRPLINFGNEVVAALPSAIGTAIRRAVIETCQATRAEFSLWSGLFIAQNEELSLNPALSSIGIPSARMKQGSYVTPSEPVEFQPGLWFQLILLADDFAGFSETGFDKPGPNGQKAQIELQQAIDYTAADIKARPGFKLGFSLVVLSGFGRGNSSSLAVRAIGQSNASAPTTSKYSDGGMTSIFPNF